jgi:hypothetical protein
MNKMHEIYTKEYLRLINEWTTSGSQSLINFPKSRMLGLYKFSIGSKHANTRDYERSISYSIGEPCAFKILDEGCEVILQEHSDKLKIASYENLIRFNIIVKVAPNDYFNFVVGFTGPHSAELFTSIIISKNKYEKLKTLKSRMDANGNINYIITLHDF